MKSGAGLLAVLATLGCLGAQAQGLPGASVDELLALARERNPELASLRHDAAAAAERVDAAGALPDPRLRSELMDVTRGGQQSATVLPARAGSARYTLLQDVPWFGKRDLRRDIARFEADSASGQASGSWSELAAKIKTTHAQLYALLRSEALTREILDLLQRLERIAQVRYAGGLAAQQDVIRAQLEQSALHSELIAQETEHHHLQTRLNALLGRAPLAPLASPERLRPLPAPARLDYTTLAERARARNPLLAAAASRLGAAEKGRELSYANRYPDFTVGVVPNQFQNEVKQWDLMLEINIPLQQSARRAQERAAEAAVSAAQARLEASANELVADLAENLAGLDAARRSEALAADSLLPQSELTFRAAIAGYENGKLDFATLLDAQRQIRLAKQTLLRASAESRIRLAEIERIVGEDL